MLAGSQSKIANSTDGNFMSESQFADYLSQLRINRTARLNGSRPAPPSRYASKKESNPRLGESADTHVNSKPSTSNQEYAGRPLVPEPLSFRSHGSQRSKPINTPVRTQTPSEQPEPSTYIENGARWMDRQETHSLRVALEDMDAVEDQRIHEAAQDEASKLVYEHTHPSAVKKPEAAHRNPELPQKDYHAHLRKGSYERSHSKASLELQHSKRDSADRQQPVTDSSKVADTTHNTPESGEPESSQEPRKMKSYHGLASAVAKDVEKFKRRVSSGGKRKVSNDKGPFPNPSDKIYEEPTEAVSKNIIEPTILEEPQAQPEIQPQPSPPVQAQPQPEQKEVPSHVRRNPFARVRFNQEKLARTKTEPVEVQKVHNTVEIHRNPPSQSRKPWYLANKPSIPNLKEQEVVEKKEEIVEGKEETSRMKDGLEVRSDDIRAATSMKRKDRSPNLPQPTAVSDSPGRPIVSFQREWKQTEVELEEVHTAPGPTPKLALVEQSSRDKGEPSPQPARPHHEKKASISAAEYQAAGATKPKVHFGTLPAVAIPSINLPDGFDEPSRTLPEEPVIPTISMPDAPASPVRTLPTRPDLPPNRMSPVEDGYRSREQSSSKTTSADPARSMNRSGTQSSRPLPNPSRQQAAPARPLPHHSATAPVGSAIKPQYQPSVRRTTALCAHCALPIAGRILSAAGERFHPECFRCHLCATNLECVAFYPEPDQKHYERIARIQQRNQGFELYVPEGMTFEEAQRLEAEDGDEGLRFFCHLDYHELFSPRCKSCKTPIEGEVVVACGSEWHVGHFFCAQCGDPFDSSTPFVERDGYAWCVCCHTNRYSPKCKKCRKPITDLVVNALGSEWHGDCFSCMECGGGFEDGRYFLRGASSDPVCVRCEDRRLKS